MEVEAYLESLQMEFMAYYIRQKLYRRKKDVDFCEKVTAFKLSKINEIADKHGFITIFNDAPTYDFYYAKMSNQGFFPNFHLIKYKSDKVREEFELKDFKAFFSKHQRVLVEVEQETFKEAYVVCADFESQLCQVRTVGGESIKTVSIKQIKRKELLN